MKISNALRRIVRGLVLVLLVGVASPVFAGYVFGPASADFTYLGSPDTSKWDIGPNVASKHTFSPPNGPGTPGAATFSIMGPGLADASGSDTSHGANTTVAITSLNVPGFSTEADYASVVDWALDSWADASGFTNLGQVPDGGVDAGAPQAAGGHLGDIRVAAWELTIISVAHAFQPGTEALFGAGGTLSGDIHLDVNRIWHADPNDTATFHLDIYSTLLHEMGHALGLGHSDVPGSVMHATYAGPNRTLRPDDVAAIQALYGVPEPSTIVLAAIGAGAFAAARWRRRVVA